MQAVLEWPWKKTLLSEYYYSRRDYCSSYMLDLYLKPPVAFLPAPKGSLSDNTSLVFYYRMNSFGSNKRLEKHFNRVDKRMVPLCLLSDGRQEPAGWWSFVVGDRCNRFLSEGALESPRHAC